MPSWPIIKTSIRELVTFERTPRVVEPDLVMDNPDKVAAYTRAGRVDGVMAPVYLFHCANICEVIRPGETVIDLACGPATQLALVAQLNPDTKFIGIDLSEEMLEKADAYIKHLGLSNVEFQVSDISKLKNIADNSIDAVMSTMALHHLPEYELLNNTFAEINRVLKSGGGVYLADFSRLKSKKSINYFAYQYQDRQPELFTLDYLYSLHAAFSLENFKDVSKQLNKTVKVFSMVPMPFMVAVKSQKRRELDLNLKEEILRLYHDLPEYHKVDIDDLITTFGFCGMKSGYLIK